MNLSYRSSHQRCSLKTVFLKNFTKFSGKHLRWSLLFNKVSGMRPASLLKKRLQQRCFPVNFVKCLRTAFFRSSRQRCFAKFIGKHLCQSLFLNKVRPATLLKNRLQYRCFPVNFAKYLRIPFLQNTSGRLLLFFIEHFTTTSSVCN